MGDVKIIRSTVYDEEAIEISNGTTLREVFLWLKHHRPGMLRGETEILFFPYHRVKDSDGTRVRDLMGWGSPDFLYFCAKSSVDEGASMTFPGGITPDSQIFNNKTDREKEEELRSDPWEEATYDRF